MAQPLVSIIIPTYNRAQLIGETLDSVIAQTYTNWECIVVDDGSKDDTSSLLLKYCEKDSRIQYHHRPKDRPKGANACRNYGFEISKGEYINWFDDDDVMLDNMLFDLVKHIHLLQNDFIFCSYFISNEKLTESRQVNLIYPKNLYRDYALWNFKIITHCAFFKRNYLNNLKLFSPEIYRGQETEFFLRIFYKISEYQYSLINKPLFIYRLHKNTKTFKDYSYNKNFIKSKTIIYSDNLEKSFRIDNLELITFFYKKLIVLWYKSLNFSDFENVKLIRKRLLDIVKSKNTKKYLVIYFILKISFTFKLKNDRFKYFLKRIF